MSGFPDPRSAPGDRPLARGGNLEPSTLLGAYARGIFPWPVSEDKVFWWSPDPRAVIPLDGLHVSRTLRRTLRAGRFRATLDQAFPAVIGACADRPEGTWITAAMRRAYTRLHGLGHAHSVEVWDTRDELVGGVYGVACGAAFMGESMFHRATDASKVALVRLVDHLRDRGFLLFDVQLQTPHLGRMGAVELDRDIYLDRLAAAVEHPVRW